MSLSLCEAVNLIALAIRHVDQSGVPYRSSKPPYREYAPGVGPYSETVLCQKNRGISCGASLRCMHGYVYETLPDLLIPVQWALELKLARPFGDNAKEAEHWSQNLLHPYEGDTSSLGDAIKLKKYPGAEKRGIVVVGYEHEPATIDLSPLVRSFELIAESVLGIQLGVPEYAEVPGLSHRVHQKARIWAWEVL